MHSPSTLPKVRKILSNHFGGTKTNEQLETIKCFFVNETEIICDQLWNVLPKPQQLQICAYFRYNQVDNDSLIHLRDPSNNSSNVKLLFLVKGSGELVCGDQVLHLDVSNRTRFPCLGSMPIPSSLRKLLGRSSTSTSTPTLTSFNKNNDEMKNIFQSFMQKVNEDNETSVDNTRPSILLQTGSHYISLNCRDCQLFMEKLLDNQISQRALHLLKFHAIPKRKLEFITFPMGHTIFNQGEGYDKIILTIRGMCQLKVNILCDTDMEGCIDETTTTTKHVSSSNFISNEISNNIVTIREVGPLSFLGFIPYFIDGIDAQPISVIALTKVRVLIMNVEEFLHHMNTHLNIREAFTILSRRQHQYLERFISNEINKKEKMKIKPSDDEDVPIFPSTSIEDIETIIRTRTKKNPRLSKHKVLKEFKRLVRGGYDDDNNEDDEYEDLFLRFDFSDECLHQIKDILGQDWGQDDCNDEESITTNLKPFPSILLNRKRHGKTLPSVIQSHGYLNPFASKRPSIVP